MEFSQVQWISLVLFLAAAYWLSEWPRRFIAGQRQGLAASKLACAKDRHAAWFFVPFVFVVTSLLTLVGMVAARWFAPELIDQYFGCWTPLLMVGASGTAVGVFEASTGMVTEFWVADANSESQRFRVDPALAERVGSWRIFSCVSAILLAFAASRFLPL